MKLCIFPGTFNPIHNAHIKMAEFALKNYGFDKIIFIPSYIPPHKEIDRNLAKHRYNMVKLAISDNKNFEISDIEYTSDEKSYTVNTVKKFIEKYQINGKLNMIIGTDAFVKVKEWYHADELKNLVHFIVFPRRNYGNTSIYKDYRDSGWSFELTQSVLMNVSSTKIRKKHETDTIKEVEDYIESYGLYKS